VDEDTCMVDMARYFLDFVQDESCGKCSPCRIGTKRMLEIITRICEGKGEEADIDKLINLGNMIKDTALCGLGQTAPNPVLSTIRHFREEYEAHIRHKRCPAGVCPGLVRAPCQNACPAGVDVPGYISLIGEGRFKEAVILHRENNPFPGICSRVCPHVCETKCRRQTIDQPTGIRQIKRFMADQDKTLSLPEIKINLENKKKKIAIIGAGPAGLSCGYFLARLGYAPTIYEAAHRPGGMLLQGIPDYRLPRQVLNKEIGILKKLGVKIKTNVRLGEDITVRELRKTGAQIVFLGLGAHRGSGLNIPGEDKKGVVQAVDFLRDHNLGRKVKAGRKVVVIGGGNAAVDAARTAVRLGAEEVTILYRRTQAEMPAYKEEVEEAQKEGINIKHLVSPVEITGDSKVEEIKCGQMALGDFDKSGRRRPISIPAKTFLLETDMVIPAVGQSADLTGMINNLDIKIDQRGFIEADPVTGQTSVPWIFSGGDIVSGPATVVEAVAGGERAAVGIDKLLSNKDNAFWRKYKEIDTAFNPDEDPVDYLRVKSKTLPLSCRKGNFKEIELCLSEKSARKEAKRCLRCEYKKIAPQ
ncbi:MAG: FAD-dependent oxidoreductase, partial [Candidatus Omnitrophica bacterium]|nr:FAD-dependent oxidoreductase [Candidatus Omnitrophota bacterium]